MLNSKDDKPEMIDPSITHRCAYCGESFLRFATPCMPFCSIRCQQIDLGNWLDEEYGLPMDGHEDRDADFESDQSTLD